MKRRIVSVMLLITLLFNGMFMYVSALGTDTNGDYAIGTAEELMEFAETVNAGDTFEGKKVYLTSNIDLTGKAWVPIGYNWKYFNF